MTQQTRVRSWIPGPAGGITAAQWAALQAMVASDAAVGSKIITVTADNAAAFLVEQADGDNIFQVNTTGLVVSLQNGTSLVVNSDGVTEQFRVRSNGHLRTGGTTPTIAAGAAAGTSPTVTIPHATDTGGVISVTTGTGPTTGTLVTVTFANAYTGADFLVMLTPGDADAAAAAAKIFVDNAAKTTTTFKIEVTGSALSASTNYIWNYFVMGLP